MRISLQAKSSLPLSMSHSKSVPLLVTIKPANNVPGSFEYRTDSDALLQLLRRKTDLSGYVLDSFRTDLEISKQGRIRSVDFNEDVLQEIGYFID